MLSIKLIFILLTANYATAYFYYCDCSQSSPLLPGADVLAGGFDATQLATNSDREFMSQIFEYTFYDKRCMRSNMGGACYRIPDQLYPIDIDMTTSQAVQGLYYSSYEYISTYSESFSSSVGFTFCDFGASIYYHQELYDSEEYLTTSWISQGFGYFSEYLYSIIMPPAYVLNTSSVFSMSLDRLPSTIQSEADNDMYNQLIQSYGSSYLISVIMGGRWHLNQYTNDYTYTHYSEQWETEQMGIEFQATVFNMEMGYYSNSSEYTVSSDYEANSNVQIYCMGGDPSTDCGNHDWLLSIPDFPSYLNVTYAPLYMLVYGDQAKHDTLKKQIEYYTQTGKLPEYNP